MARSRDGPLIGLPFANISPEGGGISPASSRSKVVLPQPEGPTIERNSPSATDRSILSSTRCVPKDMLSARASNALVIGVFTYELGRDQFVDLRLLVDEANLRADIDEEGEILFRDGQ